MSTWDGEPPPDHDDFVAARRSGLRSIKKYLRNRLTPLGRARRWSRAWKACAKKWNWGIYTTDEEFMGCLRTAMDIHKRKEAARVAELEEALRELSPLVGMMLDEEWFWQWTPDKAGWARRELGRHRCQGGDCVWKGSDDHEPTCHVSKLRNAMRHVRKVLDAD